MIWETSRTLDSVCSVRSRYGKDEATRQCLLSQGCTLLRPEFDADTHIPMLSYQTNKARMSVLSFSGNGAGTGSSVKGRPIQRVASSSDLDTYRREGNKKKLMAKKTRRRSVASVSSGRGSRSSLGSLLPQGTKGPPSGGGGGVGGGDSGGGSGGGNVSAPKRQPSKLSHGATAGQLANMAEMDEYESGGSNGNGDGSTRITDNSNNDNDGPGDDGGGAAFHDEGDVDDEGDIDDRGRGSSVSSPTRSNAPRNTVFLDPSSPGRKKPRASAVTFAEFSRERQSFARKSAQGRTSSSDI